MLAAAAAAVFVSTAHTASAIPGVIDTYAGGIGDGGAATNASVQEPTGVAVDSSGNLYLTDRVHGRVRKVTPSGTITTVAGDPRSGSPVPLLLSGDGGPATSALLGTPDGVAVDSSGALYIADAAYHRIRKVSSSGTITTVAGNGVCAEPVDGVPATASSLCSPRGVAVDAAGAVYIADTDHFRIRKVGPSGSITTVAGNGSAEHSGDGGPATSAGLSAWGVAVDSAGAVYIASANNDRIRKVDPSGTITTVAGNGTSGYSGDGGEATEASLSFPTGVAVDLSGNLYIADNVNSRIRRVTPSGTITTVAGNGLFAYSGDGGKARKAALSFPYSVAVSSSGVLYIADSQNNRVRAVSRSGKITTVAGNGDTGGAGFEGSYGGDGGVATSATLNAPAAVAVSSSGALYISDTHNHRIRAVSPSGTITTVVGNGIPDYSGDGGPPTSASLFLPTSIALDSSGTLYIADTLNNRIRAVSPSGTITTVAGNGGLAMRETGGRPRARALPIRTASP